MTLYICPAGTSVAQGPLRPGEDLAGFEARLARRIDASRARHGGDPRAFLIEVAAETNGLARSDCGPGDEVLLLASDTADGERCAQAVAMLIGSDLGARAGVERVEGLVTTAPDDFRQKGIRNLLRAARSAARASAHSTVVINITGGFKGVVPYLTLLGMFHGIDVVYVFETSDALIRLPPLPIRFDHERIAFALPALLALKSRDVMPLAQFNDLLPGKGHHDDPVIGQLIEVAGGLCTLSAAGDIAAGQFASPQRAIGQVFVRHAARNSALFGNDLVQKKLRKLGDPSFRAIPLNSDRMPPHTDLYICKPLGPSAPRLYYRLAGDDVFVVEILEHREHEAVARGERRIFWRDYQDQPHDSVSFTGPDDADAWAGELSAWIEHCELRAVQAERSAEEARSHSSRLAKQLKRVEADAEAGRQAAAASERGRRQALQRLMDAASFAAHAFRAKTRKDADKTPYVNHLLQVVQLLADAGVSDGDVLVAGLLHDAIEDVGVTGERIEQRFGPRVRALVEEVTDDKTLPKEDRKRLQIEHAARKSADARLLVLADKIANLRDLAASPPQDWEGQRVINYFDWAKAVIDEMGGDKAEPQCNLEERFAEAYAARPAS